MVTVKLQKRNSVVSGLWQTYEKIRQIEGNNTEYFDIGGTGAENGEHGAEIERKNEPVKRLPPTVTFSIQKQGKNICYFWQ